MKRGILYVTAALLMSLTIPEVWANGPGGRGGGGGRGGWGGGGGCHGGWGRGGGPGCGRFGNRCGFRGGWCGGGNVINGGFGGYGGYGYACGFGGYGCATPYSGYGCGTGVTPASYYINYSPTITTGAVAPATAPVVAESTSCSVLASGDLVGNVQRALRARGYYNGPIDGMAGAPTRAAIRAYAAKCGLPATGVIDGQLLTSLGLM